MKIRQVLVRSSLLMGALGIVGSALAQDARPGTPGYTTLAMPKASSGHFGTSPFAPPKAGDRTFVVDQGPDLDTACIFKDNPIHSPLEFDIPVNLAFTVHAAAARKTDTDQPHFQKPAAAHASMGRRLQWRRRSV